MNDDQLSADTRGLIRRVIAATARAMSANHPCVFAPWAVGVAALPTTEHAPGLHAQLHAAAFGAGLVGDQLGAGAAPADSAPPGAGSNTDRKDDDE
ncbi:hypothetical protein [Amycolatopsis sp. CA-128772]|uniref:hypothetical protein n=1 Tax=Amycolatopsis sp. CA-128772 TaxID=2073159 RepID=UPI000CD0CADA|nr:hypothetical protein [Amycolatopsis sp. CA-128772]